MSAKSQELDAGKYLAHARGQDCGNCGQEMVKAHRIHRGTGYCSTCYPRVFPSRACHVCGKPARAHRNDENPVCSDCLREDRSCLRCGKLTPKAGLRVGTQVACASCAHYYKPAQPCDMCATPSTRLSRSSAFPQNGRMCERCLRAAVGATCSHCRKHRTVNAMTLDRKPLCKSCCATPAATHACPDCGDPVPGAQAGPCFGCAIKRANAARVAASDNLLVDARVRRLYADFTTWCHDTGRASKLAAGASRFLQFAAKLDVALMGHTGDLDHCAITRIFSTEELRQMGLLARYMSETGLLKDNAIARRRRSDERLLDKKLAAVATQPWFEDLGRFDLALSERDEPLALRTRKAYLHAAIALLTHAAVPRVAQITQKALDAFVAKRPGMRASLCAFLGHLEDAHGVRIQLKAKAAKGISTTRRAKYVRTVLDALDALEAATERPARLALTATLLATLLNKPMEQILRLRHSDLDLDGFRRLRIDGNWRELPARLVPILRELPSQQWRSGIDADPLVFEGRLWMDALSVSAVSYHVKPVVNRTA